MTIALTPITVGGLDPRAHLHRHGSPSLRAALAAQPRWASASSAWDTLAGAPDPAPAPTVEGYARTVADALLDGDALPGDFWTEAARVAAEQAAHPAASGAMMNVARHLLEEMSTAAVEADGAIHRHLNTQLGDALTGAAAALDALGDVDTPQAAIAAGRTDAWSAVGDALTVVTDIRSTQAMLSRRLWGGPPAPELWRDASEVANIEKAWPDYPLHKAVGHREDQHGQRVPTVDPRPRSDGIEYLRWLTRPDLNPWVPDRRQYEQEAARLSELIAEHRPSRAVEHAFTPGGSRAPFAAAPGRRTVQP